MAAITASREAVRRRPSRGAVAVGVLVAWIVAGAALKNRWNFPLAQLDTTWLHQQLNDLNNWVGDQRATNPFFTGLINPIREAVNGLVVFLQNLISQPSSGRPVPVIGWLGVVALVALIAGAIGTWRTALLAGAGFAFLGLQGLWQESMDTLALTLAAVLICLVIGIPLGIWAGVSDRVHRVFEPILDFLQTMPSFAYLSPLSLFFLIGPAAAVVVTVVYAMPPAIRYTAHGIRTVPVTAVEAAESIGTTRWQRLRTVQLPMAGHAIVLGINQTIMAALAMATIAALIAGPGLGATVVTALESLDVGTAFNAGLAIVVLAIVLDRMVTAAGHRTEIARERSRSAARVRPWVLGAAALVTVWALYLSRTYLWAADFPANGTSVGTHITKGTQNASDWVRLHFSGFTVGLKNWVSTWVLDPLQNLLVQSPWFIVMIAVAALVVLLAGWRAGAVAVICLGLVVGTGVWSDAMATLAMTIVGTIVTVVIGVVVGVWMARSHRVDAVIRPILDALQVMPAFVYLVPFLALFQATRFTAVVAAVLYAAPVAIKVVADGVRGVSPTAVEAGLAAGSTTWQQITKIQVPMARDSLVLAANQSVCYVLSMVVVGGLVGAQALGYDVVAGFSQPSIYGKGLAAGFAIVFLGILLNQTTAAATQKQRVSE